MKLLLAPVLLCAVTLQAWGQSKGTSIEEAITSPHNFATIRLSCDDLSTFEQNTTKFINLENLYLTDCRLDQIPKSFFQLSSLKLLNVQGNRLTSLDKIESFKELRVLNVRGNQLGMLPQSIAKLQNLRELDMANNPTLNLQPTIQTLGSVEKLDFLYLSGNGITVLPEEMKALSSLVELHLSENPGFDQVKGFELLSQMVNLKILVLANNEMESLAEEVKLMTNLEGLVLDNNPKLDLNRAFGKISSLSNLKVLLLRGYDLPEGEQTRLKEKLPRVNIVF